MALLVLAPPRARAQEDDARALFERGTAAVHEGRFADARVELERSLTLAPRAPTAFNLVIALRGMGQLVRAGDVCETLLADRYGAIEATQRAEAERVCADARAGIARLRVRAAGESAFELRIDGLSLGEIEPGDVVDHSVDPGAHVVTLVAPGHPPVDRVVELERGAQSELELLGPPRARTESGPDVGLVFGITAGSAALVAAIAIVAVVATSAQGPVGGDFPVTATLLRF